MLHFNELLSIRKDIFFNAKKENKSSPLHNFYIFNGKYYLDQFAQMSETIEIEEINKFFPIPFVCSDEEMKLILNNYNILINAIPSNLNYADGIKLINEGRPERKSIILKCGIHIPDVNIKCPHCGKGWNIDNISDSVFRNSDYVKVPIKTKDYDFTGQRITYFWNFYEKSKSIFYNPLIGENAVTNEKYIDNTLMKDTYPSLMKNANGFNKIDIDDKYILQENDNVAFNTRECYHVECNKKDLNEKNITLFKNIFNYANINYSVIYNIKNEYCSNPKCSECSDWFLFKTEIGIIKIGWRKSVINIDWSKIGKIDGKVLFKRSDSTHDTYNKHAWSELEAINDLIELKEAFFAIKS